MLNVIIHEGLYDKEFVEQWCFGFKELKERVQQFTPEKVEKVTWVPKNKMREAARIYATTKPASITQCLSIDQNADTISTSRSIAMLAAITGNIDVPGGNLITMLNKMSPVSDETGRKWLSKEHHEKRSQGTIPASRGRSLYDRAIGP